MANEEQLAILKQGVEVWNKWRDEEPDKEVNLMEAYFRGADLRKANLRNANLRYANFYEADLTGADLTGAALTGADLVGAYFGDTNLRKADLSQANLNETVLTAADLQEANLRNANLRAAFLLGANLSGADLSEANLTGAVLFRANLSGAVLINSNLVRTDINDAKISNSRVYGINVWDLKGEFEEQKDLIITEDGPPVTVDNIKVAQFIYLILNNKEVRDVLNTLTSKSVLILGRFTDTERKGILDALRNKLREYNLLPIVFDFDRPVDRNITETVKTLAAISYFVIADVTSPKSSPLELQAIVPNFQIPVVPIIQEDELPFSMIADLQSQYNGVLGPLTYHSKETLIQALKPAIIDPAIEKHHELQLIKAQERKIRKAEDFIDDKGLDSQS